MYSKVKKRAKKYINNYFNRSYGKLITESVYCYAKEQYKEAVENDKKVGNLVSSLKWSGNKVCKAKSEQIGKMFVKYVSALDSVALFQKDSMNYNGSIKFFCEEIKAGRIHRGNFSPNQWCELLGSVLSASTRICAMDTYREIYNKYVKNLQDKYKARIIKRLLNCNCGDIDYITEIQPLFDRFSETLKGMDEKLGNCSLEYKINKKIKEKTEYILNILSIADMCFVEVPGMYEILEKEIEYYSESKKAHSMPKVPNEIYALILQALRKDRCIDSVKSYVELYMDDETNSRVRIINAALREIETGEIQKKPQNIDLKNYQKLLEFVESGEHTIEEILLKCSEEESQFYSSVFEEKSINKKIRLLKDLYLVKYLKAKQKYWNDFNEALKVVDEPITKDTVYFVPCGNYLVVGANVFPLLMVAKKMGYECIPSSPNTFEFNSNDEELNKIGGCFYGSHFKNVYETKRIRRPYKIDIPNKIIEVDGFNVYEPIYEVVSRWQFSLFFNFETNAWARAQVYKLIIFFQNTFEYCEKLHNWAKDNKRPVRVIHSTPHVQEGAAWRIYCEEKGYEDNIKFIHVRSGYDDYFNSGCKKTKTISALNLTDNPDKRMSIFGTAEGFRNYYERNVKCLDSISKKANKWFEFQRSVNHKEGNVDDELKKHQIIDRIKEHKGKGKKVYLLIGKLIFDLGVKWTKGTAHDDMSHWATHIVETVNKNDEILLLIKPHPHETRVDITMSEESVKTFRDIILTELGDNVIYLDSHLFRNIDLVQYVDVGFTWNSTSSLELAAMGIKVVMGDEWGYLDYPLNFIKLNTVEDYENFINNSDDYPTPEGLKEKAIVFLDYMGSGDVNIQNNYSETTSSNFNTFESKINYEEVLLYEKNGDKKLEEYFNKIG